MAEASSVTWMVSPYAPAIGGGPVSAEYLQLCSAANSIGNEELEAKFNDGIKLIKRDIIFAASLYL